MYTAPSIRSLIANRIVREVIEELEALFSEE